MRLGGFGNSSAGNRQYSRGGGVWGRPVIVQHTKTNRYDHEKAVVDTIKILKDQARAHATHPCITAANMDACAQLRPDASQREIASAIFYWIRGKLHFVEDEAIMYHQLGIRPEELDKELLITPPVLLSMPVPMGDCDDYSLLTASMALNSNIQPYYVTIAADPNESPQKFSHIYVCVRLADENKYMCLDAGNRYQNIPPGWETQKCTRKAVWKI
jgi:hypothetical protein